MHCLVTKKKKLKSRTCSTKCSLFNSLLFLSLSLSLRSQWWCCPWSSVCGPHHEQICFCVCSSSVIIYYFVKYFVCKFSCYILFCKIFSVFKLRCDILFCKIYTIYPQSHPCLPSILENVVDLVTEKTITWFLVYFTWVIILC